MRISGLLTTNREPTSYHFSEIARSFEDSCEDTNSIAIRSTGRGFVHPAFCKNGARTDRSVLAPLFLRHFRKKPIPLRDFLCSNNKISTRKAQLCECLPPAKNLLPARSRPLTRRRSCSIFRRVSDLSPVVGASQ